MEIITLGSYQLHGTDFIRGGLFYSTATIVICRAGMLFATECTRGMPFSALDEQCIFHSIVSSANTE